MEGRKHGGVRFRLDQPPPGILLDYPKAYPDRPWLRQNYYTTRWSPAGWKCPKCGIGGVDNVDIEYHLVNKHKKWTEHLHVWCLKCGFNCVRLTADDKRSASRVITVKQRQAYQQLKKIRVDMLRRSAEKARSTHKRNLDEQRQRAGTVAAIVDSARASVTGTAPSDPRRSDA